MTTRHKAIHIPVGGRSIEGTLVAPDVLVPGVMLVHGWDGSRRSTSSVRTRLQPWAASA